MVIGSGRTGVKAREERLLETIVTTGGVRLQPTRDALQVFLAEAAKLDAVAMSRAIEIKLRCPLWQVGGHSLVYKCSSFSFFISIKFLFGRVEDMLPMYNPLI